MTEQRSSVQLVAEVDTTQTRAGFNEIAQQAGTMAASVGRSGEQAQRAVSGVGIQAGSVAAAISRASAQSSGSLGAMGDAATRSSREIAAAERNMLAFTQRTRAALEAGARSGSAFIESLARSRGLDPTQGRLGDELSRLRELEAAQARLTAVQNANSTSLNRIGVSAAQTAAALRGIPAQFTDIVTSLQGGQAPLTVLMQQGGQLRDMFGSAGGAARALGGYVLGLINPFTVAAAVAVGLAVAYNEGSKEAQEFSRAIIISGNAAGTSANQLANMSKSISQIGGGTQGAAASALTALVGTGRVGVDNLQAFGLAAVKAQKAIGQSVEETAKSFADLGKSPLQASEKLNEQYRFLTGSVYAQIKALQDQGRVDEAGEVAQKAYAAALTDRSQQMVSTLGVAEKAWGGLTAAAKRGWDSILDVGREDTLEEKLAKVQAKIAKASVPGASSLRSRDARVDLSANLKEEESLKKQIDAKTRIAAIDAGRTKFDEADLEWARQITSNLSRQEQLKTELAANTTRGLAAGASDKAIEEEALKIRKKYSDIYNAGIDSQIEAIKRRGAVEEEVAKRSAMAIAAVQAAGIASSLAAQIDYAEKVEANDQAALAREKQRLQLELTLTKGKANSEKEQAALRGQIGQIDEQALTRKQKLKEDIYLLDVKDSRQAAATLDALGQKREAELQSLTDQLKAQRDSNSLIGKSKAEINAFNLALAEETATRLENQAAIIGSNDARKKEAADMVASAAQIRALAQAKAIGVAKEVDFEATKKSLESLDNTAHDVFTNIFNGGKSAFDRLRDTLKSGLLDMLYQMTVKKWIFNIGASVTGYSGLAGAAQAANTVAGVGNAASGIGALGTAGTAIGTYNMFAGAGTAIAAAGNAFGMSAVSAFGAGLSNTAGIGMTASEGFAAAGMATEATAAAAGSAISSAFAAALPWAAAAAAAYLLWDNFMESGPEKNTRLKFSSNNTAGNISINERGNEGKSDAYIAGSTKSAFGTFGVSSTFWAPAESETIQSFIKTVGKTDDALASFLTAAEKASVSSYLTGKDATANVGAEGNIASSGAELSKVFAQRIANILDGIEPGLSALESSFVGTSQELATETAALLQYRAALKDSGQAVFGATVTLQQLAALGLPTEATSATLNRVTADFNSTNVVLASLGKTSQEVFGAIGLASFTAREQLVLAAGGTSALTSAATYFAQNFLTEAEKIAPVIEVVNTQMAALGYSGVKTTQQFADAARAIDLNTDAGRAQYVALMALAPAFKQVTDYAATLATALPSVADAKSALTEAYAAERDAIKATISSTEDYVTSLVGLRSSLLVGDLSPLTPEQKYAEAKKQYEATKVAAMSGDTKAQSDLSGAITTFLTASREVNASNDQYKKDFAEAQNDLGLAISAGQQQAITAKASLTALEKQVTGLTTINSSVLSVADAIKQLASAMGKDGVGTVDASNTSAISSLYQSLLGRAPDSSGLQFWTTQLKNGVSLSDISGAIAQSEEYKKLHGSHKDGLAYVPFDGYRAELHQGEAVLTATENINYKAMGTGANAALVSAVKSLQAEVAQLRAEQAQQTGALIASNMQANDSAANKVAAATVSAAEAAAWANKTTPVIV